MSAWTFRRRKGECTGCERAFEDGESYHSVLAIQGEELARRDLCRACWKARDQEGGEALFWWRTRHETARKKGLALDLEAIQGLFLGLEGREQQHLRELRYVLCLLLLRKRRLKLERIERAAEGEAMVVRRPRRQEALRVHVFDFDAERMAELQGELQRVFDSEEGLSAVDAGGAAGEGEDPGESEASRPAVEAGVPPGATG